MFTLGGISVAPVDVAVDVVTVITHTYPWHSVAGECACLLTSRDEFSVPLLALLGRLSDLRFQIQKCFARLSLTLIEFIP